MNSEKKADLTFEVVNRSTDTFTDVEIRDDRYDLIAQADSLPSGNHTMTAEVSMGQEREFTFYLTFKDPNGDLMEYVSDPIWVRYPQAAVTQAPAATPAPTAELQATIAPMPTQNSADKPMDLRHIGLVVGFVVLGILVLAAIVALIILVPRIVENIRVMQDHRERLERDATRSRSTAKRRRK